MDKKKETGPSVPEKPKYLTVGPVDDYEEYGVYVEVLDASIKDPNVKNIGIIGPYGGGKSSLLKTWKSHSKLRTSRICEVSLANFSSEKEKEGGSNSENDSGASDKSARLIEKSILEQLLFEAKPHQVPFSKIQRI